MHWYYRVTGVDTVTLYFGERIDITLVDPIRRAAEALKQQLQQRVVDLVPSYTSLLIRYDLLQDDLASLIHDIGTILADLPPSGSSNTEAQVVEIPVFYHPSVGPDLEAIASRAGLSVAEVIERHSARLYNVYAIGFAPGFAYLGEVPAELATPRLDTPRARVPAGTLGIADTQTAIYPLESPGGWNLIGRTPIRLFDPERAQPALLTAGQQVRFRPVSQTEYLELGGQLDDLPEPATAAGQQGGKPMSRQPGFVITRPGFLTLLQDAGRQGVMHMGLATGGAMDRHAWAWGNRLLGNPWGTPALEVTFGNLEFRSELDTQIAVTGAAVSLTVNGAPRPLWSTISIQAGDTISLSTPKAGIRSYLAVAGGFRVRPGLGHSCATFTREGTGGLHQDGRPLQAGDHLPCAPATDPVPNRRVPEQWQPDYQEELVLEVIPCAQVDRFPAASLATFFSSVYTLTPQTDRMGARLKGPALEVLDTRLISEGTSLGAIQVPPDGQPIILLNDRQTIGGYPKPGTVTPRSLDALAQRPPGTQLRFRPVALHQAQQEERRFLEFFRQGA